jgi:hypothetical protein
MPEYIVQHLDSTGCIIGSIGITCPNDTVARAAAAMMLRAEGAAEVWCDDRFIGVVSERVLAPTKAAA